MSNQTYQQGDLLLVNRVANSFASTFGEVKSNILDSHIIQSPLPPNIGTYPDLVEGTVWIDISQTPPVLNIWDGSTWNEIEGGSGSNIAEPEPGDLSFSPGVGGDGTQVNPFKLDEVTSYTVGGTVYSENSITISNQEPFAIVLIETLDGGLRFQQDVGYCDENGQWSGTFVYVDQPNSTEGSTYNGKFKIGTETGVFIDWSVVQVVNKTPIVGGDGTTSSPNATPPEVDNDADKLYGTGTATWADGSGTLSSVPSLTRIGSSDAILFGVNGGTVDKNDKPISDGDTLTVIFDETLADSADDGDKISGALTNNAGFYQEWSMTKNTKAEAWTIDPLVDQALSATVTSTNSVISGINAQSQVDLINGSSTLTNVAVSVNGEAFDSSFPVAFNPGDTLQFQGDVGGLPSTEYKAIFSVGGTEATWSVTTVDAVPTITQPTITSPANGAVDLGPEVTLVSSDYYGEGGVGAHNDSSWEVYESDSGATPKTSAIANTSIITNAGGWVANKESRQTAVQINLNNGVACTDTGVYIMGGSTGWIGTADEGATVKSQNLGTVYLRCFAAGKDKDGNSVIVASGDQNSDGALWCTNALTAGMDTNDIIFNQVKNTGANTFNLHAVAYNEQQGRWCCLNKNNSTGSNFAFTNDPYTWPNFSAGALPAANYSLVIPYKDEFLAINDDNGSIYRNNGGNGWVANGSLRPGTKVGAVIGGVLYTYSNSDKGSLYVHDEGGIGSVSWRTIDLPAEASNFQVRGITGNDDGYLLLSGYRGSYYSLDSGKTWTSATSDFPTIDQGGCAYNPVTGSAIIGDGNTADTNFYYSSNGTSEDFYTAQLTLTDDKVYSAEDGGEFVGKTIADAFKAGDKVVAEDDTVVFADSLAFSTTLYSGTGSDQTVETGVDNTGKHLLWTKNRTTGGNSHQLVDSTAPPIINGSNISMPSLMTDRTEGRAGYSDCINVLTSSGFVLGAGEATNRDTDEFVAWNFRGAPGFFDVVAYTGNNQASQVVPHSLGVAPAVMIVKNTDASDPWTVYHKDLGINKYLSLNTTNGAATSSTRWGAEPTDKDFTVDGNSSVNSNNQGHIAYLFADNPDGGIKCGKKTGTGFVECGFKPGWIMYKNTETIGDWVIFDNKRRESTTKHYNLPANKKDAESSASSFEFQDTGFDNQSTNSTFIYVAIAEDAQAGKFMPTGVLTEDAAGTSMTLTDVTGTWQNGMAAVNQNPDRSQPTPPPATDPPSAAYTKVVDAANDTANLTSYELDDTVLKPGKAYHSRVKYSDGAYESEFSPYNSVSTESSFIPDIGAPYKGGFYAGQVKGTGTTSGGGLDDLDVIYNLIVAPKETKSLVDGHVLRGESIDGTMVWARAPEYTADFTLGADNQAYGGTATSEQDASSYVSDPLYQVFGWAMLSDSESPNGGLWDPTNSAGTGMGGYNDWYVPSLQEMANVYYFLKPTDRANDQTYPSPAYTPYWVPPFLDLSPPYGSWKYENPTKTTVTDFQEGGDHALKSAVYWTTTTEIIDGKHTLNVYAMDMNDGQVKRVSKSRASGGNYWVRSVRREPA